RQRETDYGRDRRGVPLQQSVGERRQKKTASEWRFSKDAALGEPHFLRSYLFPLSLLEHAIDSLVRRIAASLRRLCRLQSLVRGALSSRGSLLRLSRRALCGIRCVLRSFSRRTDHIELFRFDGCAAGHDRKAADE